MAVTTCPRRPRRARFARAALALARDAADLLWPSSCPSCGAWIESDDPDVLCAPGALGAPLTHARCLDQLPRAPRSAAWPRPLREGVFVRFALADGPELFRLLHAAKYGGRRGLLAPLGALLGTAAMAARWLSPAALLVPVPDDPLRRQQRGFSALELLAEAAARQTGCTVARNLLRRRKAGPPQARQRDAVARDANVADSFAVGDLACVERTRPLILLDDQVTSGATVRAVLPLLAGRGNPVLVLALAGAQSAPREVAP